MTNGTAISYYTEDYYSYQVWDSTYQGLKVVLVERKSYPSRIGAIRSLQAQGYTKVKAAPMPV
jgi:hypothetical protein